jgi:hypothetical protein
VVELVHGIALETGRVGEDLPFGGAFGCVVDGYAFRGGEGAEVDHADYAAVFTGCCAFGFAEVLGRFATCYAARAVDYYYDVVACKQKGKRVSVYFMQMYDRLDRSRDPPEGDVPGTTSALRNFTRTLAGLGSVVLPET